MEVCYSCSLSTRVLDDANHEMELSLNLFWLLIAVSALYAWSRRRGVVAARFHLIALICVLALLFPVISATDDLHAMRPEIEDAASNRRSVMAATAGNASSHGNFHFPSALPMAVAAILPLGIVARLANSDQSVGHPITSRFVDTGRGPPVLRLA